MGNARLVGHALGAVFALAVSNSTATGQAPTGGPYTIISSTFSPGRPVQSGEINSLSVVGSPLVQHSSGGEYSLASGFLVPRNTPSSNEFSDGFEGVAQ